MLGQYLPIVGLMVVATLFATISFIASKLFAPRRPNDKKLAPYECGIIPTKDAPERFPVRFYLVAMIFIVFDIEIIFFYPWAISHHAVGVFGLVAVLVFSALVFESFVYLISNGALDWGPIRQNRTLDSAVSAQRTTSSTVRRVGLDGREPRHDHAHEGWGAA